jgi:general secretion pathway protein C
MLDLFFKKYAWTASLVLIFAAAWLCARTVNVVLGAAIRPRPAVDLAAAPAPRRQPPAPLEAARLYALIGQEPPAAETAAGGDAAEARGPQNCWDASATPVKTGLRAQLVAAVVADDPRLSLASITDLSTHETQVYGVGDEVLNAQVLSVEKLRDEGDDITGAPFKLVAIVCNEGRKEYLDFEPEEAAAPTPAPIARMPAARGAPANPRPGGPSAGEGVKKVSDNRYEVKRSFIDSTLSNLNQVATQARIVPSFRNGVANGFKLFSIQPGSLYSAIGMQNGDVIQRINGYEINSPDKALEVYQKLRESSHITIDVDRNGQSKHMEYNVDGS